MACGRLPSLTWFTPTTRLTRLLIILFWASAAIPGAIFGPSFLTAVRLNVEAPPNTEAAKAMRVYEREFPLQSKAQADRIALVLSLHDGGPIVRTLRTTQEFDGFPRRWLGNCSIVSPCVELVSQAARFSENLEEWVANELPAGSLNPSSHFFQGFARFLRLGYWLLQNRTLSSPKEGMWPTSTVILVQPPHDIAADFSRKLQVSSAVDAV